MDFVTYANSISANRNLGYWSVIPYTFYGDQYSNTRISDPTYAFWDENGGIWNKIDGFVHTHNQHLHRIADGALVASYSE
jgi:hypothetical protein